VYNVSQAGAKARLKPDLNRDAESTMAMVSTRSYSDVGCRACSVEARQPTMLSDNTTNYFICVRGFVIVSNR
jgi:hypothetical protein